MINIKAARQLCEKATPGPWMKAIEPEYDADYETANHLVGGPTGRKTWHLRRENELRQWNELSQKCNEQAKQITTLKNELIEKEENDLMMYMNCDNLRSVVLQSLKLKFPDIFGEDEI